MAIQKRNRQVDVSILDRLTEGFIPFLDAVVQVVENADDAHASEITIRFYSDSQDRACIDFIDNGEGMNEMRQTAYVTLGGSTSRSDVDAKGRNGTGRLGFRHHCSFNHCVTKTADGLTYETTLNDEVMLEAWFGDGNPLSWKSIRLPFRHVLKTSGSVITWANIAVGNPSARAQRKPDNIIEHLAQKISPHVAHKVTVEALNQRGETVMEQKLKPRITSGDPIKMEIQSDNAGDISIELYVVAKADKSSDCIMVGTKGPICPWQAFMRMFRDDARYATLVRQLDIVIGHPQVVGYIDFPILKPYRMNDSHAFSAKMLDNEELCHSLFETLRMKVMPRVENELGMRADQLVTTSEDELVRQIVTSIHDATGEMPSKQKVAILELNNHRIDIKLGDTFVFRVEKPQDNARYLWDDTKCGGSLDKMTGTEVIYTATTLGTHTLTANIMGEASVALTRNVRINVMEKVPMSFVVPTMSMSINDSRLVRLQNIPEGAKLEWENQDWGGDIVLAKDLSEATVTSGAVEGDFDVSVVNTQNSDDIARCTLRIKKQDDAPEPKKIQRSDVEFTVRGHTFRLTSTKMAGSAEGNATVSWFSQTSVENLITLNFGHQVFTVQPNDRAKHFMAVRIICERVAEVLAPQGCTRKVFTETVDEITNRFLQKALPS